MKLMKLFDRLNDDGKLRHKIANKLGPNSAGHGINCLLSADDILMLMDEAGIQSSDWTRFADTPYDLARYDDKGHYSYSNCRFITHRENIEERKLSPQAVTSATKNIIKAQEAHQQKLKDDASYRKKLRDNNWLRENKTTANTPKPNSHWLSLWKKITHIDFSKRGATMEAAKILDCSHTHVRRIRKQVNDILGTNREDTKCCCLF